MYSFADLIEIVDNIHFNTTKFLNNKNLSDLSLINNINDNVQQCHKILNYFLDDPSQIINKHTLIIRPLQSLIELIIKEYNFNNVESEVYSIIEHISNLIYDCSKIYRVRKIITLFNNEITFIEPVIKAIEVLIEKQASWTLLYTLTLWLSLLIMVPLKLENLDNDGKLCKRIIDISLYGLNKPNKLSDSCSFLLSYYLSRESYKFSDIFSNMVFSNEFIKISAMSTIKRFLKLTTSESIDINSVENVLNSIDLSNNSTARKLYLSAKCRLILLSLSTETPLDVSEYIGELIEELESKFNVIRWTAAKSLGRLSRRLGADASLEIVTFILNIDSLHGKSLAIGEIIRSGQLTNPDKDLIDSIISVGVSSLNINPYSVKNVCNVIDSGCFLFWSMAITLKPENLTFDQKLLVVQSLVNSCLFEISINSRRAASASLQEFLGRLGSTDNPIPNSLELATMLDYYSLHSQVHTYTKLSLDVANLSHNGKKYYSKSLIDHLLKYKLYHYNVNARVMSCICISNIHHLLPENYIISMIPGYISEFYGSERTSIEKHGILLLINGVIRFATGEVLVEICKIPSSAEKMMLFKLGDLIRQEICNLINNIFNVCDKLDDVGVVDVGRIRPKLLHIVDVYRLIVLDSLKSFSINVQVAAAEALHHVLNDEVVQRLCETLRATSNHSLNVLRGNAIGLGYLSDHYIKDRYKIILVSLFNAIICDFNKGEMSDAQFRQYALVSIANILENVNKLHKIDVEIFDYLIEVLDKTSNDYSKDERGDVGSWVREVSLELIALVIYKLNDGVKSNRIEFIREMNAKLIYFIMAGCLDKIERVRSRSLWLLHCIINNKNISSNDIKNRVYHNKNYECYPIASDKVYIPLPEGVSKLSHMDNYLCSIIKMSEMTIHNSDIVSKKSSVGLGLDGYSSIDTAFNTVSTMLTDSDFVNKSLYKISLLLSTIEYQKPLSTLINIEIGNKIASNIITSGITDFPVEALLALEFLIINEKATIDISPIFDILNSIECKKYVYLKAKIAFLLSILISHTDVPNRLHSADILLKYLTHKYPVIRQLVVDGLVLLPFLSQKIIELTSDFDFKLMNINNSEELDRGNESVQSIRRCILDNIK